MSPDSPLTLAISFFVMKPPFLKYTPIHPGRRRLSFSGRLVPHHHRPNAMCCDRHNSPSLPPFPVHILFLRTELKTEPRTLIPNSIHNIHNALTPPSIPLDAFRTCGRVAPSSTFVSGARIPAISGTCRFRSNLEAPSTAGC